MFQVPFFWSRELKWLQDNMWSGGEHVHLTGEEFSIPVTVSCVEFACSPLFIWGFAPGTPASSYNVSAVSS